MSGPSDTKQRQRVVSRDMEKGSVAEYSTVGVGRSAKVNEVSISVYGWKWFASVGISLVIGASLYGMFNDSGAQILDVDQVVPQTREGSWAPSVLEQTREEEEGPSGTALVYKGLTKMKRNTEKSVMKMKRNTRNAIREGQRSTEQRVHRAIGTVAKRVANSAKRVANSAHNAANNGSWSANSKKRWGRGRNAAEEEGGEAAEEGGEAAEEGGDSAEEGGEATQSSVFER